MKQKSAAAQMCGVPRNDAQKQLIRIVKTPEDEVLIDLTGKSPDVALIYAARNPVLNLHSKPVFGSGVERQGFT